MEAKSSTEERRAGDDEDEVYELYSPCYYLHLFIKSLLKCLGFTEKHTSTIVSEGEEEEGAIIIESDRSVPPPRRSQLPRRKPARPPVSTGGGSQVN